MFVLYEINISGWFPLCRIIQAGYRLSRKRCCVFCCFCFEQGDAELERLKKEKVMLQQVMILMIRVRFRLIIPMGRCTMYDSFLFYYS